MDFVIFLNIIIFNQYNITNFDRKFNRKKDAFIIVNEIRIFISRIYPSFVKSPVSKSSSAIRN